MRSEKIRLRVILAVWLGIGIAAECACAAEWPHDGTALEFVDVHTENDDLYVLVSPTRFMGRPNWSSVYALTIQANAEFNTGRVKDLKGPLRLPRFQDSSAEQPAESAEPAEAAFGAMYYGADGALLAEVWPRGVDKWREFVLTERGNELLWVDHRTVEKVDGMLLAGTHNRRFRLMLSGFDEDAPCPTIWLYDRLEHTSVRDTWFEKVSVQIRKNKIFGSFGTITDDLEWCVASSWPEAKPGVFTWNERDYRTGEWVLAFRRDDDVGKVFRRPEGCTHRVAAALGYEGRLGLVDIIETPRVASESKRAMDELPAKGGDADEDVSFFKRINKGRTSDVVVTFPEKSEVLRWAAFAKEEWVGRPRAIRQLAPTPGLMLVNDHYWTRRDGSTKLLLRVSRWTFESDLREQYTLDLDALLRKALEDGSSQRN